MTPTKRGRPPVEGRARPEAVMVRLTAEERLELEAAAEADNRPLSQWMRLVVLEVARRSRP